MDLSQYFSIRRKEQAHDHHNSSHSTGNNRSYLPLLANPIHEDVREILSGSSSDIEKLNTAKRVGTSDTSTFAGSGKTSRGNVIIYKQHHEASTIELFYDLFFVANLGMEVTNILEILADVEQPTSPPFINTLTPSVRSSQFSHSETKH
jgi:hypothetical protein